MPTSVVSESELVGHLLADCAARREGSLPHPVVVADTNGQAISLYAVDPDYAAAIDQCDIVHADGQFVVWLSRVAGGKVIPERTATTDLIHAAARASVERGLGFFLLGGSEEINRRAAEALTAAYPGLRIAGRHHGYFADADEADLARRINTSGADVLWVGLGKPKEQQFAVRNRALLSCGWIVTCGGCFHFLAGDYRRAPAWMQRLGLEWLHRMATGPRYLMMRYLVTIPHALWLALRHDLLGSHGRTGRSPEGGAER
jgi:exopolysaccharide biosynthesis WecB/TagA/CpsF family protein